MLKPDYVEFDFKFKAPYDKAKDDYGYVQLAKHRNKNTKKKILLVLDKVPSEDLKTGRLLSGPTGKFLSNLLDTCKTYYGEEKTLDDYNWLAISHHAFKTVGEQDSYREGAKSEFARRLKAIIAEYKPDTVLTFGPDPYKALNSQKIEKYGGKPQHLYGVPIKSRVKTKGEVHKFKHIPSLSLQSLVNDDGSGSQVAISGYVCRNIVNALHGDLKYKIPKLEYKTTLVDTIPKFKKMLKHIKNAPNLAIDTETENLNRRINKMLTIQFAIDTKRAFVLPVCHKDSPFTRSELDYICKRLKSYFEKKNNNQYHIFVNATFDLTVIRNACGVRYFKTQVWDLFAGEYALDENLKCLSGVTGGYYYSLLNLSMQYGCTAYYDAEFGKDQRKTIVTCDLNEALIEYCSLDVIVPMHIIGLQQQRAKDEGYEKFDSIVGEQISDMLHTFSVLEFNGCPTDIDYLFYLKTKDSPIRKELENMQTQLYQTEGVKKANAILCKRNGMPTLGLFGKSDKMVFDIAKQDHQQLLFFDVLGLKAIKMGKENAKGVSKGKIDKAFQAKYKDKHAEVDLYQKLGKAKKLYNSYVKSLIKQWGIDDDMRFDRHIRPHFEFLDVVTGRTSAKKPSLHQVPSRGELGKHIKRLFMTEEGRVMIKVDYSAHEVRCFDLNSYISTEIGKIKLKEFLETEQKPLVHSFNHDTQEVELKSVGTQSIHAPPEDEDMFEIAYEGGTLTVTGNHQIWSKTRNTYIRADDIQEGEELLIHRNRNMKTVRVTSVRKVKKPELVCDVGVEDNHNLFVCDNIEDTPVLVHNCWSLFTGDTDVASLFDKGRAYRDRFKLAPNPELLKKIDLEGDVHKINASYFFGVDIEKVDKKIRDAVKQVIFGLIYQQGLNGLAASTGQTRQVISDLVEAFKKKYPIGVGWFDEIKEFARQNLYVESPLGRRRHTWGHMLPPDASRNAESAIARNERQSVNSPIQGMGSDFLINGSRQIERLRVDHEDKTGHYPDFYQANSVHDSIIFSCAYEDVWTALKIIEEGLTTAVAEVTVERHGMEFIVPLEIDFEIGANERDVVGWDYSMEHMDKILKGTLKFQKEFGYDIDPDEVRKDIMENHYDDMPEWAQKQCWNMKLKLPGMVKDSRKKKEKFKVERIHSKKKAA
jgi:DNA polymerase I-like protein with 3'-5' exonuclease and polymerase domains